ncbi:hypothetical protein B0H13DRAFT_1879973 [Mycena leptocephala]|nr:hypothetical protein B0H13DRAFT_1879973 [Mycena leptocephala]
MAERLRCRSCMREETLALIGEVSWCENPRKAKNGINFSSSGLGEFFQRVLGLQSNKANTKTRFSASTPNPPSPLAHADIWFQIGHVYEQQKDAVYRDGQNPTFWCSICVLYFQINQYRDALDAYSRAIRINPYLSEVWFDLGSLYESCNNQISVPKAQ